MARFEREAKVLGSLNHPHIAQIYGIEESSGVPALVMELVPGEPIRGPSTVAIAINYAKQIAQALEAAHQKGIVHVYREKGMFAESVAEYQCLQRVTGSPMPGLAVTYARMGKIADARAILREMLDMSARKYVSPEQVALIYASLGEKDNAFAWVEKAYEARSAWLITGILVLPQYDPLRAYPRFSALLRKMRIEK